MVKDSNNLSSDPLLFLIGNFDLELKSVISILSESNYQFIKAPTFESGMHQSKIPDLILIELSQLQQNGINFFTAIKADPRTSRTPVVVISASLVSPERQFQIIQQGAASVVCSPIHPFELLGSVFAELRNLSEIAALKKSEHDCMVGKKVEGLTIREAYTRTESGKVPEILDEVERSGEPFVSKETPYSIKGDDGKSRPMWVNEWFYPFLNLDGKVTGILGMAQDVTEQVQVRHEVSSVLNSLPAFITRVDLHKRIIFINHSNEKYFGPLKNILGKSMRDYFGADYGKFKDKVDSALNGTAVEFEWSSVPLVDGLVHHFMVSFTPERSADGKVKGFITCLFNIDPLKKSEAALRLTQEHLGLALEAGQMGTWEVDLKTQDLTGSAHLLEIHGINELPQDLTTAINLTVHPEDRDALRETLAASVKDHTSFEHHYRIVRPSDGAIRWLEGRGQAKYNGDGEANCLLGIVSDITEKKLLQLEAERARQELHNYFMQAPVPLVILTGPDHHFTLANAPYERLVGRKVVGKTVREAFSDKIAKDFIPLLDQVYRTGVPFVGNELPIQFPDEMGQEIDYWINVGYQPARDKQGNTIGLFAIVHDVTEQVLARKNLENSEARLLQSESMLKTLKQIAENERAKLASIFAQSPGAIAVFEGPNHVFTMANPAYVTQFFGGRQDLIGQSVSKAVPEAVEQGFEKLLNTVYQTGVPYIGIETPIDLLQPDGKMRKFHLNLVYQPLRDTAEKITGIVAVITDATEQVATRIRLQESEARLQAAKSEAEKANQTKSSFLANMSHEIRTPLSAILGFTDLLKDSELSFRERNQFLETISRNGKALTTIIDDILDLAKVESGKLDIENLNISLFDLIDDVMDVFRERTHSKNIFLRAHLNKNTPARVFSDPTRIRQILINLVGNAVKFTTNGGVTIEVSASENSDEKTQVTILVKDTGVGLTSEQKERLFQPFMQADNSTTRKFGGTGLGLALSKRLAGALGGDIFIEANENAQNGCTFGFTFAASVPKQSVTDVKIKDNTQKNIEQNDQLLSGVSVLLAEDSTDNQLLVRLVLTKQGATVETANNGAEAFKMGMNGNFDIALMDIQMPEMDGYQATRALHDAGFKKPIVALTAHAMPEERARTLAAGCSAHLTKPLNQAELIETIERLTRHTKNNVDPRRDH